MQEAIKQKAPKTKFLELFIFLFLEEFTHRRSMLLRLHAHRLQAYLISV
jgi:hypothetical protein